MKNTTDGTPEQMRGYEALAAAILQQAIKDYKTAIRNNNFHKMLCLERFFLGELGQILSYNHGELIIERCRNEVNGEK
jgi:hypothetical protein